MKPQRMFIIDSISEIGQQMIAKQLVKHKFIYTIRRTATETVYRSRRNAKFVLKIKTLSQWS